MGTFKKGMHEGYTGKVGSLVGYYLNGQWVVRGLPKKRSNQKPLTEKEVFYRMRFKLAQYFLKPIINIVRMGFEAEAKQLNLSGHNLAKSFLMREAMDAENNIIYEQFKISKGPLESAHNPSMLLKDNSIVVNWECPKHLQGKGKYDQALILAYDLKRKFQKASILEASRIHEKASIKLSVTSTGKTYHVWLGFVSLDRTEAADSVYLGEITAV